jgi:hypothetical protein
MFNHQGGRRGGDEFRVPNWWMGMLSRKVGSSDLTINTMLSLDPLPVGKEGYRELFQIGETLGGGRSWTGSIRMICSCSSRRSGVFRSDREPG